MKSAEIDRQDEEQLVYSSISQRMPLLVLLCKLASFIIYFFSLAVMVTFYLEYITAPINFRRCILCAVILFARGCVCYFNHVQCYQSTPLLCHFFPYSDVNLSNAVDYWHINVY